MYTPHGNADVLYFAAGLGRRTRWARLSRATGIIEPVGEYESPTQFNFFAEKLRATYISMDGLPRRVGRGMVGSAPTLSLPALLVTFGFAPTLLGGRCGLGPTAGLPTVKDMLDFFGIRMDIPVDEESKQRTRSDVRAEMEALRQALDIRPLDVAMDLSLTDESQVGKCGAYFDYFAGYVAAADMPLKLALTSDSAATQDWHENVTKKLLPEALSELGCSPSAFVREQRTRWEQAGFLLLDGGVFAVEAYFMALVYRTVFCLGSTAGITVSVELPPERQR